eukprot:TRINITY_DN21436_c0_g1_i1.p1 TRINITY_DN21436_c0_g1~~TRINITY_DN21436_c0_g1_i1.p1  ORF type:complete len:721 (+),score=97.15 TRINITY_DN21436_c0_g1_i1:56-2218(+)
MESLLLRPAGLCRGMGSKTDESRGVCQGDVACCQVAGVCGNNRHDLRIVPSVTGERDLCSLVCAVATNHYLWRRDLSIESAAVTKAGLVAFDEDAVIQPWAATWSVRPEQFGEGVVAISTPRRRRRFLRRMSLSPDIDGQVVSSAQSRGREAPHFRCEFDDGSETFRRDASWVALSADDDLRCSAVPPRASHVVGLAPVTSKCADGCVDDSGFDVSGSVEIAKVGNIAREGGSVASAKALLRAGQQQEAKAMLHGMLRDEPSNVHGLLTLAIVCDVMHDHVGFADCAGKVVGLDPRNGHAWLLKGMSDCRRGEYKEAEASFFQACLLCEEGAGADQARGSLEMLRRNMNCRLVEGPCWAIASPILVSQASRSLSLRECTTGSLPVPRRAIFEGGDWVAVWDEVLPPGLLCHVRESVDDLCTWGLRNPRGCSTFWLARDAEARTAAEVVGRFLLEKVLQDCLDEFVGIEWWCKNQSAALGAHFHFDTAFSDDGLFRPAYSSVLYLSDEGGPTVVLDQAASLESGRWPEVPQESYIVMPRVNRWMVFPGELRHGMVPVDGNKRPRWVILYNFWRRHSPGPPTCQVPDFASYEPVSARAVTRQYLLSPEHVSLMQAAGPGAHVRRVKSESLECCSDCSFGSTLGELPFLLPMPSPARLRRDRAGDAAVLRLRWRRLAEMFLSAAGVAEGGGGGGRCDEWPQRAHGTRVVEGTSCFEAGRASVF